MRMTQNLRKILKQNGFKNIKRVPSAAAVEINDAKMDDRLTVTRTGAVGGTPPILHFQYKLSERRFSCWDTVLAANCLYLELPSGALPEGSKEGLTSLLEFAEESLKVGYVFLWFYKAREDRLSITKTFHYMGFEVVKPGHPQVPTRPDLFFMVYSMDNGSSDEE